MKIELSPEQRKAWEGFSAFTREEVLPLAEQIDREEALPRPLIEKLARAGFLAGGFPEQYGGRNPDPIIHGLMHEALGAASGSAQGLVNVHHMAGSSIARWGTPAQQERWLPKMAAGEVLGAFALTEPAAGSDARVETSAELQGDHWVLNGVKRWITCATVADLFVLLAKVGDQRTAFLVPANTEGLTRVPIRGLLGCRGWMLAELRLENCRIPKENILAKPGFGLSHVMLVGLDNGRHNLAWCCLGMGQACLDLSLGHAERRKQFGAPLKDHQLIQRLLSRMVVGVQAARMLCWRAAYARATRQQSAVHETMIAKYQASQMLSEVSQQAVQLHGAQGCTSDHPAQRHARDARIMEIVEGSTQMLEIMIAKGSLPGTAVPPVSK